MTKAVVRDPRELSYEELETEYMPFLVRLLNRLGFRDTTPMYDHDDWLQELRVMLWRAQQSFNPKAMPNKATGQPHPSSFRNYLRSAVWNKLTKIHCSSALTLKHGAIDTGERNSYVDATGRQVEGRTRRIQVFPASIEKSWDEDDRTIDLADGSCDMDDVDLFVDMPEEPRRVAEHVLARGRYSRSAAKRDLGMTDRELMAAVGVLKDRLVS
jgi:hypothetical protein